MKDQLLQKLNKYQYKNNVTRNNISINLGLSQIVSVEFAENDNIIITDKLESWKVGIL